PGCSQSGGGRDRGGLKEGGGSLGLPSTSVSRHSPPPARTEGASCPPDRTKMEGAMRRTLLVVPLLAVTLAAPLALADAPPMAMLTPGDIKWGDVPPVFPKGAKMAVLYGDPSK